MSNPYKDIINEDIIIREFNDLTDDTEFVWHRDEESRLVEVLEGKEWMFQYDNELPFELKEGEFIKIQRGEWHRLHKGSDKLIIKITILEKQ
tara:strand:+ start:517 stop:792 length:276 start_codon:yes stop_codon:yes gene_type:complete